MTYRCCNGSTRYPAYALLLYLMALPDVRHHDGPPRQNMLFSSSAVGFTSLLFRIPPILLYGYCLQMHSSDSSSQDETAVHFLVMYPYLLYRVPKLYRRCDSLAGCVVAHMCPCARATVTASPTLYSSGRQRTDLSSWK